MSKHKHISTDNLLSKLEKKKIPSDTPEVIKIVLVNRLVEMLSFKRKDGTTFMDD